MPSTEGMVLIKGGFFEQGSNEGLPMESPAFTQAVDDFYMDIHPVTVAQFRKFIDETGYKTQAEQFGNAGVLNEDTHQWELRNGANWQHPNGSAEIASDDHPVTQVSWNDAQAYCKWAGKRLPTESEFEYAARAGNSKEIIYPWGKNRMIENGKFLANVYQGQFPILDLGLDGFTTTSPVKAFPANAWGLYDMAGNVWQWTADEAKPYVGNANSTYFEPESMIVKGGSFLCDSMVCHSYRITARQWTTRETSNFHTGFRCVVDLP